MTTLQMNMPLLELISTVQTAQKLFLRESILAIDTAFSIEGHSYLNQKTDFRDHLGRTRNYFFAINTDYLEALGLVKNEFCLEAICRYRITEEMEATPYEQLGRFTFAY